MTKLKAKQPLPPLSDQEEAAIQAQVVNDPDESELTDSELVSARPFTEMFPELAEAAKRSRGRPATGKVRKQLTLRVEADVLERYKATGPGWQTRMTEILRRAAPR